MLSDGNGSSFFEVTPDDLDATGRRQRRNQRLERRLDRRDARRERRGPHAGWQRAAFGSVLVAAFAVVGLGLSGNASADPSAQTWYRLRMCESSDNYATNTGNAHYGAYQFDLSTWRSVGGRGYPNLASKSEQDKRALILYRMRGWQPWQCARILGLHEDRDAGSGRTDDITFPTSSESPNWPGTYYVQGMSNAAIAAWQKQMVRRGATQLAPGNGSFGPLTAAVVHRVQVQNGIPQSGRIGPETWAAAWSGTYRNSATSPKPKTAPRWPGSYYTQGMDNRSIAAWQKQMARRGAHLQGTGQFGPKTQAVVDRLQRLNGIPRSGRIGPLTWAAAWTGKY